VNMESAVHLWDDTEVSQMHLPDHILYLSLQ